MHFHHSSFTQCAIMSIKRQTISSDYGAVQPLNEQLKKVNRIERRQHCAVSLISINFH